MNQRQIGQSIKVHSEIRERFHELLRYHFSAFRKGKEAIEVRKQMREWDMKEQKALLSGKSVIKTAIRHENSCYSTVGNLMFSMPCNCTPSVEVKFIPKQKNANDIPTNWGERIISWGSEEL